MGDAHLRVDVHVAQEQIDQRKVALGGGDVQRTRAALTLVEDRRPMLQQHPHQLHVSVARRHLHRHQSVAVRLLHVRSAIQQHPRRPTVGAHRRRVQRRPPVTVHAVRVGVRLQQRRHRRQRTGSHRGVQRRDGLQRAVSDAVDVRVAEVVQVERRGDEVAHDLVVGQRGGQQEDGRVAGAGGAAQLAAVLVVLRADVTLPDRLHLLEVVVAHRLQQLAEVTRVLRHRSALSRLVCREAGELLQRRGRLVRMGSTGSISDTNIV